MRHLPLLAVPLVALAFPASVHASHCTGCTTPAPVAVGVAPAVIAPSGPLVITMEQSLPSYDFQIDPVYWDTVEVEVRSDDGMPIEGVLEPLEGFSPRLWRPATPLLPGTYTITTRILPDDECTGSEEAFEVAVQETLELPTTPSVLVVTEARARADASFSNYVCCDGARPYHPGQPGTGCFPPPLSVEWLDGFCAPLSEDHWLRVDAELDASTEGFFTLRETTTDDRPASGSTALMLEIDEPGCLEFEVLDLVAGSSTLTPWCPEDAAELGVLPYEALGSELDEHCEGPTYVCGAEWDEPCTPSPGEDTETDSEPTESGKSSGCAVSPDHDLPIFALLAFLMVGRPRRARTEPHGSPPRSSTVSRAKAQTA